MMEVIRNKDKLNREVWHFTMLTNLSEQIRIKLHGYEKQTRETTRHKFRTVHGQEYNRFESMKKWRTGLALEETPLPPDVLDEAKQKLIENIKFDISP